MIERETYRGLSFPILFITPTHRIGAIHKLWSFVKTIDVEHYSLSTEYGL